MDGLAPVYGRLLGAQCSIRTRRGQAPHDDDWWPCARGLTVQFPAENANLPAMCGHFIQHYTWREIVALYRLTQPAMQ